jgi:hypothetical protein
MTTEVSSPPLRSRSERAGQTQPPELRCRVTGALSQLLLATTRQARWERCEAAWLPGFSGCATV